MNVIADVAGQYQALRKLVKKLPDDEIIFVGDLIDRGPDSKKVISYVRDKLKAKVVLGNHEHMMIDFWNYKDDPHWPKIYGNETWFYNGGLYTYRNYNENYKEMTDDVKWLKSLPLYYEDKDIFVSHAPWRTLLSLEDVCKLTRHGLMNTQLPYKESLIWNRQPPMRRDKIQIFGHNSHWGLKYFDDIDGLYAICIDQSKKGVLTAFNTNNLTVYDEPIHNID